MRTSVTRFLRIALIVAPLAAGIGAAATAHAVPSDSRTAVGPSLPALPTQTGIGSPAASPSPSSPSTPAPSSPAAVPPSPSPSIPSVPTVELPSPLGYRIHTVFKAGDGTLIDKTTPAVLLVPALIDVDGSLTQNQAPDVLVQLTIDAGRATMRVTTLPGAANPLPLKVEAIIADPRGTSSLEVAYGFDALDSTAPAVFSSTVQLFGASRVTSVALDLETTGAGPTLTVIGEVYTPGANNQRLDPQIGTIRFTPVPTISHFGIIQGSDIGVKQQSGIDLVTDTPTKVHITIEDIQAAHSSVNEITIDKVPNALSLILTDGNDGTRNYTYQASDPVSSLSLDLTDRSGSAVVDEFALALTGLPTRAQLIQDTATHATFSSSGPVGSISAGSAHSRAIAWLNEPAYLYTTDRGAGDSFAFKILGLSRAEYDTGDPFLVDVDIAPGPFHVLIENGTRTIDVHINDLPGTVRIQFSNTSGTLDYAGSDRIGRIAVDITDPAGLAGRAKSLHLTLDGVPKQLSLTFGTAGGKVSFDAGADAVDKLTLLLTSGPDLAVDDGFDGVVLEDVPDHYAVAVRLTGLKLASVTTGDPPYALDLKKSAGPFLVALTQGTRNVRVEVHDLPDSLSATIDPAGSISYTASHPIGLITATGHDPQGISGRATSLDLRIADVPASLTLNFGAANALSIDAHGARIGTIDLLLTSGPAISVDDSFDGFVLEDVADHYALVAHITGLRLASVTTSSPYAIDLQKDAGPFLARLTQGSRFTELKVLDLPDTLHATFDPAGALDYTASAAIDHLTIVIRDPAGVSGRATSLDLDIHGLPKSLTLDLPSTGRASLDAHDGSVGSIDLLLTSGPSLAVDDGFDGVVLRDTDQMYALVVRLHGLKRVGVSTAAPYSLDIAKTPGPFLVDLLQGARSTRVEIHDLPSSLQVTLDPNGSVSYTASAPIGRVAAVLSDPAGVSGRATLLKLELDDLPAALSLNVSSTDSMSVDAHGARIGNIDLLLTSGPVITVDDGFDGFILQDVADHYAFVAHIGGLRLASVSTAAPYSINLQKDAGPFLARLQQADRFTEVKLLNLPDSLQATFDPAGSLSYDASAAIGELTVEIRDPAGVSGRATSLSLDVHGLPKSLDLNLPSAGNATLDANGASIGLIELLLTSGPTLTVDDGFDGIVLRDTDAVYQLALRLHGLRHAGVSTTAPYSLDISKDAGPFLVDLQQGARWTHVEVHDLPAMIQATLDPAGQATYTASDVIAHLSAHIVDPAGITGRVIEARLELDALPSSLNISFASTSSVGVDANGGTIGAVDLLMTSGPVISVPAGFDGAVLQDVSDHYAFVVHLTGLKVVNVSTASPYSLNIQKAAGPFLIDLTQNQRTTHVEIHDLPSSLQATFDPAGSLSYTASAAIDHLTADLFDPNGVSGRAKKLALDVHQLPAALTLDLPTASNASIDAHGSSIGLIDLLLTSGPDLAVDNGYDGIVLRDTPADYMLAVHLQGLKHASLSTGTAYSLDIAKKAGPFLVDLVQNARTTRVEIHDLPNEIQVTLNPSGSASYTGSAPIGHVAVRLNDPAGVSGRATSLRLDLDSLPATLDVAFGSTSAVSIDAHGSSIGLIDLLLTSGPDLAVPAGFDGVVLQDVADHYALAARLAGLKLVSVSTASPYSIDIRKNAGPFLVDLTQLARTTRVEIHDLPDSLQATLDPSSTFSYTASAAIGSLRADIADPAGVAGRATAAHLTLQGLPMSLNLSFSSGSTVSFDAGTASVGLIDLLLTSSPTISVPAGFDGIVLQDVADHYALAVHLMGLKKASASTAAPYGLTLIKTPGPFLIDMAQAARTTRVEIHDLPSSIDASLDPAGGTFSYTASAAIGSLVADVTDPAGVTGRATSFHLNVSGLPASLNLAFGSGSSASLDAHGATIGSIDLLATSGPVIAVDSGYDGIVLEDVPDHYALAVHMTGLRSASVSTAAPYSLSINKTAGPFIAHLTQQTRDTLVTIHDLPSSLQATLDPAAGSLSYTASAGMGSLTGVLTDAAGVMGRATFVRLDATSLPASLTLTFNSSSTVGLDAHGSSIGSISFLATSGPALSVDNGYDGVILEDVVDHFAIAARLTGLSVARVTTGSAPYTLTLTKSPGPFLARLTQGARNVNVTINDLPSSLTATLNPAGSLTYSASAVVGSISASITDPSGVAGRATRATALLQSVPKSLDLSWAGANGAVTADAKGATVGLVQVLLTSGPDVTLPSDRDGLVLEDMFDHYSLFARVTGLKKVTFTQGPPPSFDLQTTGGRLFQVALSTQKPTGVVTTSGLIDRLPSQVSIAFTSSTAIAYRASSSVAHLTLDAFDPAGISGRANALHAKIDSLPVALDASWASTGTVTFDAKGGTVGLVEVQLTSGPDDRLDPAYDGILLNDLSDRYVVFVRLTGLQKAIGAQSPQPDITVNTTGNRLLKIDINQFSGGKTTYTRATLDRLPSTVHVSLASSPQRVFYDASAATNSLSFQTNSGDRWALDASLVPLPAHAYFCSDGGGACSSHGRTDAGSFAFDASQYTTINMFDCQRPLDSSCVRGGSPSQYISVDNVHIKHMYFNAGAASSGFDGETYSDTDWNSVTGHIRINQSNAIDIDFGTFYAQDHDVNWTGWGIWPFTPNRSGDVSCNGTSVQIQIIGIWIGITGYVC